MDEKLIFIDREVHMIDVDDQDKTTEMTITDLKDPDTGS